MLQHWLEIMIDYTCRLESVGSSDVILSIIIGSAFSASVWMFKDVSLLAVFYMYYFFIKIAKKTMNRTCCLGKLLI